MIVALKISINSSRGLLTESKRKCFDLISEQSSFSISTHTFHEIGIVNDDRENCYPFLKVNCYSFGNTFTIITLNNVHFHFV